MIEFNDMWLQLLTNGASPRKEEGTRRYWDTLSDEQQYLAYTNISRKLSERAFDTSINRSLRPSKHPPNSSAKSCPNTTLGFLRLLRDDHESFTNHLRPVYLLNNLNHNKL